MANIGLEVLLGIFFLTFSKANIWFTKRKFVWKTYTTTEALSTIKRVEIINESKFAVVILNPHDKTFVMHVATSAKPTTMPIHPFSPAYVALLMSEETRILNKYFDISNIFSLKSAAELPEHIGINNHPINMLNNKQLPYSLIYSLRPMKLETLKTYIKANLASDFIRPSKFPANALILFIRKKDGGLRLCVEYRGFNNLTIRNCYLLPLISKLLNSLGHTKQFAQLNLTNTYYLMRIWEGDK